MYYSLRHASGDPTPCSIIRLKLDKDFLRIRFALLPPWSDRLTLYSNIDALGADTNVEHHSHETGDDGLLTDWDT